MKRTTVYRWFTAASTVIAGVVIAVISALLFAYAATGTFDYPQVIRSLPEILQSRLGLGLIGLLGVAVSIGVALLPWALKATPGEIAYDTERGEIRISSQSIVDFICQRGLAVPGVHALKARVLEHRGEILVEVYPAIDIGSRPVPELMRDLQDHLCQQLEQTLGLPNIKRVNVVVGKLQASSKDAAPSGHRSERAPVPVPEPESAQRTLSPPVPVPVQTETRANVWDTPPVADTQDSEQLQPTPDENDQSDVPKSETR